MNPLEQALKDKFVLQTDTMITEERIRQLEIDQQVLSGTFDHYLVTSEYPYSEYFDTVLETAKEFVGGSDNVDKLTIDDFLEEIKLFLLVDQFTNLIDLLDYMNLWM